MKSPVSNRYVLFRSIQERPSYQIPEILFLGIRLDHVSNAPNYNDSPAELVVRYQLKPESLGFVFPKLFDRTTQSRSAGRYRQIRNLTFGLLELRPQIKSRALAGFIAAFRRV